ncbi:hypothetical protein SELMODRAFT_408169 [Selaginella moellendorffii]|uniref:Sas10 C-terminal domain-containing protein n=1 Tax=Selaginella moellendorffii TaxID=88036 RepID=D8R7F0_SELML|nr:hypothetical protein SELMODRAFT_408169 [Selaginella moellendorffii]
MSKKKKKFLKVHKRISGIFTSTMRSHINNKKSVNEYLSRGNIKEFHKNRDKLSLEPTDSGDDEELNPVFYLKGEESEDEEDEDMGEEELDDMAAKIEKQAKYLRQKTGIIEDEDEKEKADWGKRKRDYYRADNIDYEIQSSDDELPALEEDEARRIQQKIAESHRPEDFDQVSDEDIPEETDTLEKLVERSDQLVKDKVKDKTSDVPIEKVKKDFDSLSKDEKLQVVMSNAPELVGLLTELKEALHELEHKLEDGNFATREGKNYMEMKHMLLLSYCRTIVFYLLLKAEGRSVCDHPVIAKLVEIRTLLDKVRPIDKKLQQQIDKHMVLDTSKLPQQEDSAKDEVKESKATANGNHKSKHSRHNVQNAKPAEQPQFVGEESRNMLREMERLQEKARREQLLEQTRVSELQTGKRREAKRHRGLLDDLEDDLGALDQESQPKTISRVVAEAGKRQKKPKIISSDTDLPVKEHIGERRRKREVQTSGRAESPVEQSEDDDDGSLFPNQNLTCKRREGTLKPRWRRIVNTISQKGLEESTEEIQDDAWKGGDQKDKSGTSEWKQDHMERNPLVSAQI